METLTISQISWFKRRDYFSCNFFHTQAGPYEFFCRERVSEVYQISHNPYYFKLLKPKKSIPYGYICLCYHHYRLVSSYPSNHNWQKEMYRVAKINTLYYLIHAPEDLFPEG